MPRSNRLHPDPTKTIAEHNNIRPDNRTNLDNTAPAAGAVDLVQHQLLVCARLVDAQENHIAVVVVDDLPRNATVELAMLPRQGICDHRIASGYLVGEDVTSSRRLEELAG